MRAQQATGNGESRVAVNGWTACRVKVSEEEEVPLDALRREYLARQTQGGALSDVDGLARQVAQGLALGCVSQRRAAAAAAQALRPIGGTRDSRKRKSIPDTLRSAKQSRVPTAESSDAEDDGPVHRALDAFQSAADAWPRDQRKPLRAQRRQALRHAIAAAATAWMDRRRPVGAEKECCLGVAVTRVPRSAPTLLRLCVACGAAGSGLRACSACGDAYHAFCVSSLVCPACSVCATCLETDETDGLRVCDACGLNAHRRCSRQRQKDEGRWLCDACVKCLECGFVMADEDASDWDTRAEWAYGARVCGHCAAQISRARVCPQCMATYADQSAMVCCDVCAAWVHAACDPLLTPGVYEALTSRPDAAYVCPICVQPGSESLGDCLPRCLRDITETPTKSLPDTPAGVEPIEAASLLLSLTQSDVRFDHERFAIDYLQARFCHSLPDDSRCCALCALRGDGVPGPVQLGRLIPFGSRTESDPAPLWAHTECLAWAWGPRSIDVGGVVRFEGALMDNDQPCALCLRPGATFHCCAPVPCADSAYHLPCLLVASASNSGEGIIRYSTAWRRALCAVHAPEYSAMMPIEDPKGLPLFADTCVQS
ncbi:hypothetical protein GGI20_005046, partial [Coemansia sp. BCRC 34301]